MLKINPFKRELKQMIDLERSSTQVLEPFEYVTQIGGKNIRLCMGNFYVKFKQFY